MSEVPAYKKKDFISDQEVRWCPGCGDYAILSAVQMAMTKLGRKREDICFISGIGCSSRFPYYMNTYGLHTIHGRAPAFASGTLVQNPDLDVWIVTGDGDGMSIGGNHLIHAIRRNPNFNILLFNNEIYGLTKGQYSPTTPPGLVTKSSPYGSVDRNFTPVKLALGAGSTFFARTIDTDPKHMQVIFLEASKHEGCSFVEILQNCVIFNDKIHDNFTNKATRGDHTIRLVDGEPMIFGAENNKGIKLNGINPEVVTIGEDGITEKDLLVHDIKNTNIANMLTTFDGGTFPVPLGVLRSVEGPVYDKDVQRQLEEVQKKKGTGDMQALLEAGETWTVD
jgi:2-oxoglutarate ferredoxin oxidoreductase subunit beta